MEILERCSVVTERGGVREHLRSVACRHGRVGVCGKVAGVVLGGQGVGQRGGPGGYDGERKPRRCVSRRYRAGPGAVGGPDFVRPGGKGSVGAEVIARGLGGEFCV